MTNTYAVLRRLALTALLSGGLVAARAQTFSYTVAKATNVAGTYTDLGTTGTVIATANSDDANSAAQNIGFTFNYNGTAFTQFVLNTNGLLRLGANAPSSAAASSPYAQTPEIGPINSTDPADVNLLLPFNYDLTGGTGGAEYRVATTGQAPNRVCTIQWKNVTDKALIEELGSTTTIPTQFTSFSFQVKLYESSNIIEFVYNAPTAGTDDLKYAVVGIKGSSNASGQDVLATKASAAAWSTTTFLTGPQLDSYTANAHNFRATYPADAGRTYRFAPLVANDAAVTTIYTYGKLATTAALPHAVQAVVTNAGSAALTNLPVTLTVAGANTFTNTQTVATLAAGASTTVTFGAYPTTLAAGTNNLTVSVPADDNSTNNTGTYTQAVAANRVSYIDPSAGYATGGVGVGAANGVMVVKYSLTPATNYLSDVVATFAATTFAATTFQVVVYDATGTGGTPGTLLYTSPTQTRTAAAGAITVQLPAVQVGSTFYVGLKELDNNLALAYQPESPLRPNTYYFQTTGAWTATTLQYRRALEFGLTTAPACPAPSAITVNSVTTTSASVAFTAPANGTAYSVVYGPSGFNPATSGTTISATTSPVALSNLQSNTTYQVYVQATCGTSGQSVQVGPFSFTTACNASAVVSVFPYTQNFDGVTAPAIPCGITVNDVNNDAKTWATAAASPNSSPNAMRYSYSSTVAADDWFFTPGLALQTGMRYQLEFKYRAGLASYPEGLEVKIGPAATPAGQTTALFSNTAISNVTYTTTTTGTGAGQVASFTPTTAGTYYVGFHAISQADKYYLYVDDVVVTASTVTATKSNVAAGFSAEASPVPFRDQLSLKLNTLQAGPLQLTLHDAVGRVVRQASATVPAGASAVAVPEAGSLPAGVYMLTVRQGGNTQVIRVAHE